MRSEQTDSGVLSTPLEGESGTWDPVLAENLPTTRYLYDGQMCAMEDFSRYLGGTAMAEDLTRYGLGARGIDLVERKPYNGSWTTEFPIYDAHGNNIARLKRSGSNGYTVSNLRSYGAWGSVRSGVPSGNPTQRYCANLGHVQDDESGLVYMRARYYEPATGRFISEDPARDGANWYVYCGNDPVNRTDSTGRYSDAATMNVLANLMILAGRLLMKSAAMDISAGALRSLAAAIQAGIKEIENADVRRSASALASFVTSMISAGPKFLESGPYQSADKGIAAIAGYMVVCYGMLLMIDSEQAGGGGDWWGFSAPSP